MVRFAVVNAYLVRIDAGIALVDSGPVGGEVDLLRAAEHLDPAASITQIVLTHCHKDHVGSAAALAATTGATVLAGADDVTAITGASAPPDAVITNEERPFYEAAVNAVPPAPPVAVDRPLHDGDDLAWGRPAEVVTTRGHTPGGIAIHLREERLLFTGDIVASLGGRPILGPFNVSRADAIASFRRLAALEPEVACFGHGEPLLSGAGAALRAAAARL
jgi:glyoxylase-like metal-dependent hydrolase (beta-lactamase superfamily II)